MSFRIHGGNRLAWRAGLGALGDAELAAELTNAETEFRRIRCGDAFEDFEAARVEWRRRHGERSWR